MSYPPEDKKLRSIVEKFEDNNFDFIKIKNKKEKKIPVLNDNRKISFKTSVYLLVPKDFNSLDYIINKFSNTKNTMQFGKIEFLYDEENINY